MEHATKPLTTHEGVATFTFSDEALAECSTILGRYPAEFSKSAIIPILHIAQAENEGWLSVSAMDAVAKLLKIQYIEVYEVATFYSMYNLHPIGKHMLEVCHTVPCMLRGSDDIISHIESRLGIKPGETTKDGMFSLKAVECLGSCGTAPMLQCGAKFHEHLTNEKVDSLIETLRAEPNRNDYTDR